MKEQYAYSTNEENYFGRYDTPEQAAVIGFDLNPDTDTLWTAKIVVPRAHQFVGGEWLIDNVINNVSSELGECAEDWLDKVPTGKIHELELLIGDWLEAYEPITFFRIDMIREFSREEIME